MLQIMRIGCLEQKGNFPTNLWWLPFIHWSASHKRPLHITGPHFMIWACLICLPLPTPHFALNIYCLWSSNVKWHDWHSLNMTVFCFFYYSTPLQGLHSLMLLFQFPGWTYECPLRSNSSVTSSMKPSLTVPGRISLCPCTACTHTSIITLTCTNTLN